MPPTGKNELGKSAPQADDFITLDEALLSEMFGPQVVVAAAIPRLVDEQLYDAERDYLTRAVDQRRAEFGTARLCARRALAKLGVAPCALVPHADRSPWWPRGMRGSISHTDNCCAVVVTQAPALIGLGLDVAHDQPLPPKLERKVCTEQERRWLARSDPSDRGWLGTLFFSAKEAFYKCQYPVTGTFLDFQEVALHIDLQQKRFYVVHIQRSGVPWARLQQVQGKYRRHAGLVVTSAVLSDQRA